MPETVEWATGPVAVGTVLVAVAKGAVIGVLLGDERGTLVEELRARHPAASLLETEGHPLLEAVQQVLAGERTAWSVPVAPRGTPFQRKVWETLRAIPPGTTLTYGEIAERVGRPGAARAVGAACGANPIAVLVPCHRAVGRGGNLTGYRWGIERKRWLLAREREQDTRQLRATG